MPFGTTTDTWLMNFYPSFHFKYNNFYLSIEQLTNKIYKFRLQKIITFWIVPVISKQGIHGYVI
jgi:hypothetical protein